MSSKVIILGTSHISPRSIERIEELIEEKNPDVVCIELDENRYESMKIGQKVSFFDAIRMAGLFTGFLVWTISKIQQLLSKKTGVTAGHEMLTAVEAAKRNDIEFRFIDRNIMITVQKIRQISLKEKMKLFFALLASPFAKPIKKINLKEVPDEEVIDQAINEIKERTPELYNVLIHERDIFMSDRIKEVIEEEEPELVLAVVGAGHRDHMKKILEKEGIDVEVE